VIRNHVEDWRSFRMQNLLETYFWCLEKKYEKHLSKLCFIISSSR